MGKTKYLSAFERGMVVDAEAPVCVKNGNAAGFFTVNSFPCIMNGPLPEGHPANLTQL
jgi:hypothetical protein